MALGLFGLVVVAVVIALLRRPSRRPSADVPDIQIPDLEPKSEDEESSVGSFIEEGDGRQTQFSRDQRADSFSSDFTHRPSEKRRDGFAGGFRSSADPPRLDNHSSWALPPDEREDSEDRDSPGEEGSGAGVDGTAGNGSEDRAESDPPAYLSGGQDDSDATSGEEWFDQF